MVNVQPRGLQIPAGFTGTKRKRTREENFSGNLSKKTEIANKTGELYTARFRPKVQRHFH